MAYNPDLAYDYSQDELEIIDELEQEERWDETKRIKETEAK